MFERICVATDGSPTADYAVDVAIDLCVRYRSALSIVAVAPLIPVFVAPTEPWVPAGVPETEIKTYRDIVDRSVTKAQKAGLTQVTGVCLEGIVVDELLAQLEEHPADLLVMGSRGLSTAKRLLLGSVSDAVVHHAKCNAMLVRAPPTPAGKPA